MPETTPSRCNAILVLGDDHGDNSCTYKCGLPVGHEGLHQEQFEHKPSNDPLHPEPGKVQVTWEFDQRVTCPHHGLQQADLCRQCFEAMWQWQRDRCCPHCGGSGMTLAFDSACPGCEGTGWKDFEDIAKCHAGGPSAEAYRSEHFFS